MASELFTGTSGAAETGLGGVGRSGSAGGGRYGTSANGGGGEELSTVLSAVEVGGDGVASFKIADGGRGNGDGDGDGGGGADGGARHQHSRLRDSLTAWEQLY